jgi:hypothetical protein
MIFPVLGIVAALMAKKPVKYPQDISPRNNQPTSD